MSDIIYKCERCGYQSNYKYNLKVHLEKKKICPSTNSDISRDLLIEKLTYNTDLKYKCEYCPKTLNTKIGIELHESKCDFKELFLYNKVKHKITKDIEDKFEKEKLQKDIEYEQLKEKLEKEIEDKVFKKIKDTKSEIKQTNTNNIQGNNNSITNAIGDNIIVNHNNINIKICNFHSEDRDHIIKYEQEIKDCLLDKNIPRLVRFVHINPNILENSNVRLHDNDSNSQYLDVIEKGKWTAKDKYETLNCMINQAYAILSLYKCRKNREDYIQLENFCKEKNINYFELMDWLDDGIKYNGPSEPDIYYARIMCYLMNRDILIK